MVVLVSREAGDAQALRRAAGSLLRRHGLRARYRWLSFANITHLVNLAVIEQAGAFILPSDGLSLGDATVLTLLEALQCPVLLVR